MGGLVIIVISFCTVYPLQSECSEKESRAKIICHLGSGNNQPVASKAKSYIIQII